MSAVRGSTQESLSPALRKTVSGREGVDSTFRTVFLDGIARRQCEQKTVFASTKLVNNHTITQEHTVARHDA